MPQAKRASLSPQSPPSGASRSPREAGPRSGARGMEAMIEAQVAKASANEDCIKLKAVAMAYAAAAAEAPAKRGRGQDALKNPREAGPF
jgi:hypothetical protein